MVVVGDVVLDGLDQLLQAAKDAAAQSFGGEVAEEAFHHVQPGSAGGGEVQMEARMLGQPRFDLGMLVRGIVIQDQMQFALWRRLLIDEL